MECPSMQWNESMLTRRMLAELQRRVPGNVFQCAENVVNILQPITSSHIGMPLSPVLYHCINTATRHFISFHSIPAPRLSLIFQFK